jgi:hypothetical protein
MYRSVLRMMVFVLLMAPGAAAAQDSPKEVPNPPPQPAVQPEEPGEEPPPLPVKPTPAPVPPPQVMDREAAKPTPRPAEEPEKPAPAEEKEEDGQGLPAGGLLIKVSIPTVSQLMITETGLSSFSYPSLLVGGISSSGWGGGLGFRFHHESTKSSSYSGGETDTAHLVIFSPSVFWVSDGVASNLVRFTGQVSPMFGFMGTDDEPSRDLVVGYQFGVGGGFFPHPAFGVGVEVGFCGLWLTESEISVNYAYGAITATVILDVFGDDDD